MTHPSPSQSCPYSPHLGPIGCLPAPNIFHLANEFAEGKMFWNSPPKPHIHTGKGNSTTGPPVLNMKIRHDDEKGTLSFTWYNKRTDTGLIIMSYHALAP